MARIVKIQEGADGIAHAVTDEGSLFHFRHAYLSSAFEAESLDGMQSEGTVAQVPFEIPLEVINMAVGALDAEKRALSLLARAEQHRAGLERKLAAKGISRWCQRQALDRLESTGMLSDRRYASAWIRQRLRGHVEGPRSLTAALSSRGVDAGAVREALPEVLTADERGPVITRCMAILRTQGLEPRAVRARLIELGWRTSELDEAADALE
jgi:regulatory protein